MDDLREKHKSLLIKEQEIEKKLIELETKKKLAEEEIAKAKKELVDKLKMTSGITIQTVEEVLDNLQREIEKRLKDILGKLAGAEDKIHSMLAPSEEHEVNPDSDVSDDIDSILEAV